MKLMQPPVQGTARHWSRQGTSPDRPRFQGDFIIDPSVLNLRRSSGLLLPDVLERIAEYKKALTPLIEAVAKLPRHMTLVWQSMDVNNGCLGYDLILLKVLQLPPLQEGVPPNQLSQKEEPTQSLSYNLLTSYFKSGSSLIHFPKALAEVRTLIQGLPEATLRLVNEVIPKDLQKERPSEKDL